MKSSLIHNCKLSFQSAVKFAGSTEGEFYSLYNNNPPAWFSLAELHKLAGHKIQSGEHDSLWFNSEAAQVEPILKHNIEKLLEIINIPEVNGDFRTLLSPNPTIGASLEILHIIVGKYEAVTGEISVFVRRLSLAGFFDL